MSTKQLQILGSLGNNFYAQNDEPTDAVDGSLWVDLDVDETSVFPTTLPNPYSLTLTGAVSASYNGSASVSVEIPVQTSPRKEFTATLSASSWSDTTPFTQTVTVSGIEATDNPIADLDVSGANAQSYDALAEAWACVSRITTDANTITATCFTDKPSTDITVRMIVVR